MNHTINLIMCHSILQLSHQKALAINHYQQSRSNSDQEEALAISKSVSNHER
jgi:hypothetical protein